MLAAAQRSKEMSATTVPVTVTTEARALAGRLSLEPELQLVLDYTTRTFPDVQSLEVEYYAPMDDPRDERLLIVARRPGELPLGDQSSYAWQMGLFNFLHPLLAERFRIDQRFVESYGR
jgi:hypothetical protein